MSRSSSVVAVFACLLALLSCPLRFAAAAQKDGELPHVFVFILTRNSAHLLPNFFGYLEQLDYPKDRISVWIRSDGDQDSTPTQIQLWCEAVQKQYLSVDCHSFPSGTQGGRVHGITYLRQIALDAARTKAADYFFSVETDCFLVNPRTLQLLIEQKKTIVAPMLNAHGKLEYSNFWLDEDSFGFQGIKEDYRRILRRKLTGCLQAAYIFSSYLINLSTIPSRALSLVYDSPLSAHTNPMDEIENFASSAKAQGLIMFVLNTEFFGYILKPEELSKMSKADSTFLHLKLKSLVNYPPIHYSQYLARPKKTELSLALDTVFVINLARRQKRRNRMIASLEELQLNYTIFDAVDGRLLNDSYVEKLGIHYMPNWKDPWGDRPMTLGEVGCFLSHYTIWKTVISEGLDRVLIFEDDIDFEPNFQENLVSVLGEAEQYTPTWDLIYVGRKMLDFKKEKMVAGASHLLHPHHSYWGIAYLLSNRGARKLINANPFQNLLPVDEYIPILFGQHPTEDWARHYPDQTLEAYSATPLLVYPMYFSHEEGWTSDTEPPPDILAQIRRRKAAENPDAEKQPEQVVSDEHREEIKSKATKRQIEQMKKKLAARPEL